MSDHSVTMDADGREFNYPIYLDAEAIKKFIPHRDAMLFAQSVIVLAHDHYTGEASWSENAFVFQGHFPGQSVLPGVMIVEAAAQIAGIGLRAGDPIARSTQKTHIGLLAGIRKCYFKRPVTPNMRLSFDLHTRQVTPDVAQVNGDVTCTEGSVATVEFIFAQVVTDMLLNKLGAVPSTSVAGAITNASNANIS